MKDPVPEKKERSAPEENVEFAELQEKLRDALPPLEQSELRRDLWQDMQRRLKEKPVRVPWFDWALLAAAGAAMVFFPGVIPALLYHL
jgi:hypothetical protein